MINMLRSAEQDRARMGDEYKSLAQQREADREEFQASQTATSLDGARRSFDRDHPGKDFDAAYEALGKEIGDDYPEWGDIPHSARQRIAGQAMERIASAQEADTSEIDTAETTETTRKKRARAGQVSQKTEGIPTKPDHLDMTDAEYEIAIFKEGLLD
jgi:hypothetical protein